MNDFPAREMIISVRSEGLEIVGNPANTPNAKGNAHCHQAAILHTRHRRIAGHQMPFKGSSIHSVISYQVVNSSA